MLLLLITEIIKHQDAAASNDINFLPSFTKMKSNAVYINDVYVCIRGRTDGRTHAGGQQDLKEGYLFS
jgi:hypothetical protein